MLEDLLVKVDTAIRDTLVRLNRNELGIAFVVDDEGRLEGVATDGDIRRGLLDGATLESPISRVMNRKALALPAGSDRHKIVESLTRRIRLIPLLDADRRVVDYASLARYTSIPVASPSLDGNERAYVLDCLESGWISSQGGYLRKFEATFAEFLGVEHALAVSNGTVALHLALVALGIGPGDEVIVPDLTFAASASAVIHAGATPVLVDVKRTRDPRPRQGGFRDRSANARDHARSSLRPACRHGRGEGAGRPPWTPRRRGCGRSAGLDLERPPRRLLRRCLDLQLLRQQDRHHRRGRDGGLR